MCDGRPNRSKIVEKRYGLLTTSKAALKKGIAAARLGKNVLQCA
jgi:hypothetical protein